MVGSRENCVQMYKPEFKVYKWDFSAEKSQSTRWIFLSIDHSRTVHNVQSSSTLFMNISQHFLKRSTHRPIRNRPTAHICTTITVKWSKLVH